MIKISKLMKKFFIISAVILASIILISLSISVSSLSRELRKRNDSLFTAMTDMQKQIELLHSNAVGVSNDMNSIRAAVSMPPVEYPVLRKTDDENAPDNELLNYLLSVDAIFKRNNRNRAGEKFNTFITSDFLKNTLAENKLSVTAKKPFSADFSNSGDAVASVSVKTDTSIFVLKYSDGETEEFSSNNDFKKAIAKAWQIYNARLQAVEQSKALFLGFSGDPDIKALLAENKATLSADPNSKEILNLYDRYQIRQDAYSYDPENNLFSAASGLTTSDYNEFLDYVKNRISFVESRSPSEIYLEKGNETIKGLLDNPSFRTLLNDKKISLSPTPRVLEEYNDYFYYDITDNNGNKIGAFGILKSNGKIYVMDANDLPICAVESVNDVDFSNTEKKKPLAASGPLPQINDIFNSRDTISAVAIGSHENDADSIILIHGNKKTNSLYLVSIPRDLYFEDQKINNILKVYGPQKFIEELSKITGIEIEKYIQVDMYAFIDAVNIVGGIDITLENAVIDPTFVTEDNGVWGTLNYSAGEHHLNGKEALRLARSRHYSSDFERAQRQQKILLALKEGIYQKKNISTIYELINSLFKHVDTNFTPAELVNLLLSFRTADIKRQEVLSTSNVLYHTSSELYKAEKRGETLDADAYQGLWILMPLGDDWNKIRYYIRKIIGEV